MLNCVLGFVADILKIVLVLFYSAYSVCRVFVKHFLLPKRYAYKSIKDSNILITGAAGGIGKCLLDELVKYEFNSLICIDINKSEVQQLSAELERKLDEHVYRKISFHLVDIGSKTEIEKLLQTIDKQRASELESIDILINLAGTMNKAKLLTELSDEEVETIFKVNVLSQIWLCKFLLPQMIEQNSGHIVNMSSALGMFGTYKLTDYCSTKFASFGFSEALRNELKIKYPTKNLRVSIVCPFHVNTKLFNGFKFDSLKWMSISSSPESVAKLIVDGVLLEKELIGIPRFSLYAFALLKHIITTDSMDYLLNLMGFDKAMDSIDL